LEVLKEMGCGMTLLLTISRVLSVCGTGLNETGVVASLREISDRKPSSSVNKGIFVSWAVAYIFAADG
jgi:hypothetical protein